MTHSTVFIHIFRINNLALFPKKYLKNVLKLTVMHHNDVNVFPMSLLLLLQMYHGNIVFYGRYSNWLEHVVSRWVVPVLENICSMKTWLKKWVSLNDLNVCKFDKNLLTFLKERIHLLFIITTLKWSLIYLYLARTLHVF